MFPLVFTTANIMLTIIITNRFATALRSTILRPVHTRHYLPPHPRYRGISSTTLASTTTTNNVIESATLQRMKVKKVLESDETIEGKAVIIRGWVRTVRDQKKFSFIEINDGSTMNGIQAVAMAEIESYSEISNFSTGAAVEVIGTVIKSIGKGQKYEIKVDNLKLVGACPSETYPLQKKKHSQEFLRTIAHLRPRTNTISAVSRVRSALAYATHTFFQNEGFVYLQSPLITASDCEGAG